MKITAQEEYGLRCLLQLARRASDAKPVTVREVAASEGLSLSYAEKLLRVLSSAGLAESIRGARGGYRLLASPKQITVGDAVRALGGFSNQHQICARYTGNEDTCVHHGDCNIRPLWGRVHDEVEKVLDGVTLSTLLEPPPRHAPTVPLSSIDLEGGSQ